MINFGPSQSALSSFATGVQGTAYNIANINTGGFQPVSVRYQSGPRDQGVQPVVSRASNAVVDNMVGNVTDRVDISPAAQMSPASQVSHVEPAREMVNLTTNQRAFEANSVVIRASDEMIGTLIDIKV